MWQNNGGTFKCAFALAIDRGRTADEPSGALQHKPNPPPATPQISKAQFPPLVRHALSFGSLLAPRREVARSCFLLGVDIYKFSLAKMQLEAAGSCAASPSRSYHAAPRSQLAVCSQHLLAPTMRVARLPLARLWLRVVGGPLSGRMCSCAV